MEEKVVRLDDLRDKQYGEAETFPAYEAFLLQEGIELLSVYRSIAHPATRLCLLELVKAAAARQTR